jgi:hypothetical protein
MANNIVHADLIAESSWEITALTRRITRKYNLSNIGTGEGLLSTNAIWGAEDVTDIPKVGTTYPGLTDTYVRAVSARGVSNNMLEVLVHYEGPGKPGYLINEDSIQMQAVKNWDIFGNVTEVPYKPVIADSALLTVWKPRHIADVNIVRMIPCVRFTLMTNVLTASLLRLTENRVTETDFRGRPPRTWLVLSIKTQTENNKLIRVSGVLAYKQETWDGWGLYLDSNGAKVEGMTPFPAFNALAQDTTALVDAKITDPNGTLNSDANGWRRFMMYEPWLDSYMETYKFLNF